MLQKSDEEIDRDKKLDIEERDKTVSGSDRESKKEGRNTD